MTTLQPTPPSRGGPQPAVAPACASSASVPAGSHPGTQAQCCIVGGGPAGIMLGLLLARAGVRTVVLEKQADFLRDFRGDMVHPSTLRILDELGLLDAFLRRPHERLRALEVSFGGRRVRLADFGGLPERYAFVAMMPQWDFLDFLAGAACAQPALELRMQAEVTGLLVTAGRVAGVRGCDRHGAFELRAACTIGCDGRHSTVRLVAGLRVVEVGAPIDVLWFRVGRDAGDAGAEAALVHVVPGCLVVTVDCGDYWQCAFAIPKGSAARLRAEGLAAFRAQAVKAAPLLAGRIDDDVRSWNDVKLLSVAVDRLVRWSKPGLLCIGDAAHAMSPVGGIGINLAIQDAVATANLLARKLHAGPVDEADLDAVRCRRLWPTKATQALQVRIQDEVLLPAIAAAGADGAPALPLPLRVVAAVPALRRALARVLGLGLRPEHVDSPLG